MIELSILGDIIRTLVFFVQLLELFIHRQQRLICLVAIRLNSKIDNRYYPPWFQNLKELIYIYIYIYIYIFYNPLIVKYYFCKFTLKCV